MNFDQPKTQSVFQKYSQSHLVSLKKLPYLMHDLRISLDTEQRQLINKQLDPTNTGSFNLSSFITVMKQHHQKVDQAEEMYKIFRIYDQEKTGIVPTERLKKILGITLPKETFTKEQDRELRKYAREIEGRVDYQQLVREVMKITN